MIKTREMKTMQYFLSENHDFTIEYGLNTATITCKWEDEADAFENPVTLSEFKEMIETAAIKGINTIFFNCNYSTEVMRHQWNEVAKKYNVKITRISN
jgi:hypothetical protein